MSDLETLLSRADGWDSIDAHREPGGGIVLMLSHHATMDNALLVYVPDDSHVATPESEIGERTNQGGSWRGDAME